MRRQEEDQPTPHLQNHKTRPCKEMKELLQSCTHPQDVIVGCQAVQDGQEVGSAEGRGRGPRCPECQVGEWSEDCE